MAIMLFYFCVCLSDWIFMFFVVGGLPYLLCISSCGDLHDWNNAVLAAHGMVQSLPVFYKD